MSTPITDLGFIPGVNLTDALFTDAEILAAEPLVAEWISSRNPTLDLSPASTLYEVMVRPMTEFYLFVRAQADALRQTQSLNVIESNPELASDSVVDALLSNFMISRRQGAKAVGVAKVVVAYDAIYSIANGASFTTPSGLEFVATQNWTIKADAEGDTQLTLYPSGEQFYFLLPLEAAEVGSQYVIADQVQLTPATPISNFVSATTFGSFRGGSDSETNSELIARIPASLSARNLVSATAIQGVLRERFPSLISVGVAGLSSPALHRGADNIFGIKSGGFADVWVRTGTSLVFSEARVVAQYEADVPLTGDGSATYSALVNQDVLPGHYFVSSVRPAGESQMFGSLVITDQVRGIQQGVTANRVKTPEIAAYSRYGTTRVFFLVPNTIAQPSLPGAPTTLSVDVQVAGQSGVAEIQDLILDPQVRPACTDYLVRASVPCFVSLSPIVIRASAAISVDDIRASLFQAVNTLQAGESLNLDDLVHVLRGFSGVTRVELPLRAYGRIFTPTGNILDISSSNALVIPDRGDLQVTPDTCSFILDADSIDVSVIYQS